jgi:hypothetical protein
MTRRRIIKTREDVCEADLITLHIVTATPDFTGDLANVYVSNDEDDVYIGELCDPRLLALVRNAPKLAEFLQFLKTTAVLDPDEDQEWVDFIEDLDQSLGFF